MRFVLILLLAVAPGCVPVGVAVSTAIWQGLTTREGCATAMKQPDFKAKIANPKYRKYFEDTCGPVE